VVGKIAAAFLPTIAFTWACYLVYALVVAWFGIPVVGQWFFPTANWWALMLLLVPAVSLLVISIVVLVSTKARGFQEANAIGGSVILPVIGLAAAQASGLMVLSVDVVVATAVLFALVDAGSLYLIVRAFKRSRIVSYLP